MPLAVFILYPVLCRVIVLIAGGGGACALLLEPHHLWFAPIKIILGEHLLVTHFKLPVVPGNDARAALVVIRIHDFTQGLLLEGPCVDCTMGCE